MLHYIAAILLSSCTKYHSGKRTPRARAWYYYVNALTQRDALGNRAALYYTDDILYPMYGYSTLRTAAIKLA